MVHLTHSIPDSAGVALSTELGTVLFTGDYKFDQTPVGGAPADMARLAELGREGLLLLCGDSTNADRAGISTSESLVGPQLERLFAHCPGRIVVTCFASNIHRVQQVVHAAAAHDRKVALIGRSMRKNVNIGRSLGHIAIPEGQLIPPRELEHFPDEKVVIVSTGSQGEPLSALRRMAYRDHPSVELRSGDTIVFSATPIPGNERAVNETIDRLYHIGCDVVTARDAPIHASGHGYAEEVKMMLNLTQPRFVMPVHGDFKRMLLHSQLAEAVGVPAENIFRTENGTPLEIDARGARLGERQTAGMVFVDGVDIGDVADVALRDRRMLSADGIFIIVATVSEQDGSSVVPPEVLARGVPFLDDNSKFVDELREAVEDALDRAAEQRDDRDRGARIGPARRHRGVHLPAPQAAPDGPAGRSRGLTQRGRVVSAAQVPSTQDAPTTLHRPPREYPAAVPAEQVRIAPPPVEPPPPHTSLIQILFPVVGGVGLLGFAIVYDNTAFLLIAGAMIVLLLAFSVGLRWSQKRQVRKRAAEDARKYAKYLREREIELTSAGDLQRAALARLYPEPARLWSLLVKRSHVWERRRGHRDFLHVRLGSGPVPLDANADLDLGMNPLADYQAQSLQEARRLVDRRNTLRGEPVVVDLDAVGVLAVTGDRARARALDALADDAARRLAGAGRPRAADLLGAGGPRAVWEWAKWLPHLLYATAPDDLEAALEPELRPRLEQLRRLSETDFRGREIQLAAPGPGRGGRRLPARPPGERRAVVPRAAGDGRASSRPSSCCSPTSARSSRRTSTRG